MAAQPMAWHEDCFHNQKYGFQRKERDLAHALSSFRKYKTETDYYAAQIERARKLRKEKFDQDRFQPEPQESLAHDVENYTHCGVCKQCSTCVRVSAPDVSKYDHVAKVELCYNCLTELASNIIPHF